METGWNNQLQQQPPPPSKFEDEQCGVALNLAEKVGQSPNGSQQPQAGCKRKRGSTAKERISKMPPCTAGKRSSIYRGVTRHRWTGRYEAHLWDKGTWNHAQNKKGKQVYLGAYDDEEAAARAYDLAALKYWGPGTLINFPVTDYTRDVEEMQNVTREEYLASLRRKSSGFSRGVSKYRGVARHHHNGRWEARIGRVFGNKYLYLGTYSTQEEAATAYDMAAIEYRGLNAVTNFDLSRYIRWLRPGQGDNNNNNISNAAAAASFDTELPDNGNEFVDEILQVDRNNQGDNAAAGGETRLWPSQPSVPYQLPTLGLTTTSTSTKKSTPTALGLLLQSDMFKQMLEKTSGPYQPQGDPGMEFHQQQGSYEDAGVDLSLGEAHEQMYTPLQHDFGLIPHHENDASKNDGENDNNEDGDNGTVWNAFGSNFGTLARTNAISC